jgi:hypothetical protein
MRITTPTTDPTITGIKAVDPPDEPELLVDDVSWERTQLWSLRA